MKPEPILSPAVIQKKYSYGIGTDNGGNIPIISTRKIFVQFTPLTGRDSNISAF